MEDKQDKYDLYTEKIKEKPSVKYRFWFELGKLFLTAVFIGIVASVIFLVIVRTVGIGNENSGNERQEVTIPLDERQTENNTAQTQPGTEQTESRVDKENPDKPGMEAGMEVYRFVSGIVEGVKPSMVTITAINHSEDPLFDIRQNREELPGIIIADNEVEYLILSDYAIQGVDSIQVTFFDNTTVDGELVLADSVTNMAVIAVPRHNIATATKEKLAIAELGNSYTLKQGELVIAMGSFYGIQSAVDFGIAISTKEITYDVDSRHGLIYTNLDGESGCTGFLFNENGQLIGNISNKYSVNGIVAYGISDLKIRIQNLSNRKPIGYMGIIGYDISEEFAEENDMPSGAYVASVEINSPAYFAGIVNGDIITDISKRTITNVYNVERALCEFGQGTEVTVTVSRRGKNGYVPIEYTLTLGVKE